MAVAKKSVAVPKADTAVKVEKAAPVKAEEVKKEEVKKEAPAKKETVKKAATKKTTAKAEAPKADAPKKAAKEIKTQINVQYGGKSYSNEDLIKIAKDVWKYDLQKNEKDITSINLYVKTEENLVYYVINGDFSGSFAI